MVLAQKPLPPLPHRFTPELPRYPGPRFARFSLEGFSEATDGYEMKLGGCIVVKNEERLIQANLQYHLQVHGFDRIMVIDNGSYDDTLKRVAALNDERIIISRMPAGKGFMQSAAMTIGAMHLFKQEKCDWVVPWDGDEFWVSEEHGSLRKVLRAQDGRELDTLATQGWVFHPTDLDDEDQPDPFLRLRYASPENLSRVLLHRLGKRLYELPVGMHYAVLKDKQEPRQRELHRATLARFHYRYLDAAFFRDRVMNQAEGNIIRHGEKWLGGKSGYAPRILNWYRHIRKGRFEEVFRRRFYLDKDTVGQQLADQKLREIDTSRLGPGGWLSGAYPASASLATSQP